MRKSLIVILGLLYVISPIDLLPDVIPVLGWCDDLGVIGFVIKALVTARKVSA